MSRTNTNKCLLGPLTCSSISSICHFQIYLFRGISSIDRYNMSCVSHLRPVNTVKPTYWVGQNNVGVKYLKCVSEPKICPGNSRGWKNINFKKEWWELELNSLRLPNSSGSWGPHKAGLCNKNWAQTSILRDLILGFSTLDWMFVYTFQARHKINASKGRGSYRVTVNKKGKAVTTMNSARLV